MIHSNTPVITQDCNTILDELLPFLVIFQTEMPIFTLFFYLYKLTKKVILPNHLYPPPPFIKITVSGYYFLL